MFITTQEARQAIGLATTDDSQDVLVNKLLNDSKHVIYSLLGNIFTGSYKFDLEYCNNGELRLPTRNITLIESVDWKAYVGVVDDDYEIYGAFNNCLCIDNISTFYNTKKVHHNIIVTSWYDENNAPEDLKRLQSLIMSKINEDPDMREVESHKQWPRSWKYVEWGGSKASKMASIDAIINNYSLLPYT